MKNILIHIPHSSYNIPDKYRPLFYLKDKELAEEQLKMTDSYTDELFDICKISKLIFPVSRLVCDVERFRNKSEEEMTQKGMWVCYTKTFTQKPLKRVDENHENEVLLNYYDKHHNKFGKIVKNMLKEHKQCLIIDAHSFSSVPLPCEMHIHKVRPDICIGTDEFHTPKILTDFVYNYFTQSGYETLINSPFKGTIVPSFHYQKNKNVLSIMIEINRSLYMNENNGDKNEDFKNVKSDILNLIKNLKEIQKNL